MPPILGWRPMSPAPEPTDYSHVPLWKKLGVKDGSRVAVVNEPDGWALEVPAGVRLLQRASERLDVILFFSRTERHLRRRFGVLAGYLEPAGGLWVAYPKKSSDLETDLTFETVQAVGLDGGLVDNKSVAIDDDWSGVRFVSRLKDRSR
ncbi:MAG: DUF3052 family protein [Actinobacteria bacterium]|nr:DUF3052 family protein [Actinomycetota bacterium]